MGGLLALTGCQLPGLPLEQQQATILGNPWTPDRDTSGPEMTVQTLHIQSHNNQLYNCRPSRFYCLQGVRFRMAFLSGLSSC